ncbi:MAG: Spy/CpxP family protein refolding chaperone [Bacteroidales bacterium]|nr:Spy/CpxP family protein refolding chaperone [Bacteroidales bacterium]
MKSIIRRTVFVLFVSTTIMATSFAQPGQGHGNGYGYGDGNGQRNNNGNLRNQGIENKSPDLTEDQISQLKALRLEHLKEMKDFRNEMGEINAKQRTAMSANPIDQKATAKLIDKKTDLLNKQMKAQVAHRADVMEVLTEEQILLLDSRMGQGRHANNKGRVGQGKAGHRRGGNYGQHNRPGRNW